MDAKGRVIAGINPTTRVCVVVGIDDDDTWAEIRTCGLIVVPMTTETARSVLGELVPDVYAVALQGPTT